MVKIAVNDLTLGNLGVNNGAAPAGASYTYDERTAIFMKKFSGEVFNAYRKKCLFKDLQRTRTITRGKSASFNYTGTMNARYHERGTPILGSNNPPISEQVINVDDLLIADVAIDNLDELMLHFDVRQEYSAQCGEALALAFDNRCARIACLAARHAALNNDQLGGSVISHALAATDGEVLADMIYLAAQTFDEKDVPEADRHVIVKPAQYYLLLKVTDLINKDIGGTGSYQKAELKWVADMMLHKSNRVPQANYTTKLAGEHNDYTGNFLNTVGIVMNKQALGTVQLRGLKLQKSGADFNIMYQADLLVASYAVGHGILRPECAIELSQGNSVADTSAEAPVIVSSDVFFGAPVISVDLPSTETATQNGSKSLSVTAGKPSGSEGSISYQWYTASSATGDFTKVVGATSSSYTVPTTDTGTAYYKVHVLNTYNGYYKVTASKTCAVTVSAAPEQPGG